MNRIAIAIAAALSLSACASLPDIDRVQKVPEYIIIPEAILEQCPNAPRLDKDERAAIETETDYNEMFVLPLWEAHIKCQTVINSIRILNEDAVRRNTENEKQ